MIWMKTSNDLILLKVRLYLSVWSSEVSWIQFDLCTNSTHREIWIKKLCFLWYCEFRSSMRVCVSCDQYRWIYQRSEHCRIDIQMVSRQCVELAYDFLNEWIELRWICIDNIDEDGDYTSLHVHSSYLPLWMASNIWSNVTGVVLHVWPNVVSD